MHRYQILLFSSTLLASLQGYCADDMNKRIDRLETDMKKVRGETAYGTYGARVASANPQVDGYGFFGTADVLCWKLYEGGTDYLLKDKNSRGDFPVKGDVRHFNFNWEPGFKVGAGYLFEYDGWDADLEFTYYRTHAHNSTRSKLPHLFPLVGDEDLNLIQSKAQWHVHFYNLDLALGKNYFVSKSLALRPFFGLALTWIDQHRHFHFHTDVRNRITLKSKNDFFGLGPKLGLNAQFYMGGNFSCYGDVSGDLQWGDFHITEREDNRTESLEIYALRYSLHRMVPSVALGLGIAYETMFREDTRSFRIKAGYESQYWWRQNQLPLFNSDSLTFHRNSEDLSMQGLTLEFRLDF